MNEPAAPNSFESYRQLWEAKVRPWQRENVDQNRCAGCLNAASRLSSDGYCDSCLRCSLPLIVAAVQDAFAESRHSGLVD